MEVCRACNRTSKLLVYIGDSLDETKPNLVTMLNAFVDSKVELGDKMSQQICAPCISVVQEAFKFKETFEKNHDRLVHSTSPMANLVLKMFGEPKKTFYNPYIQEDNAGNTNGASTTNSGHEFLNRVPSPPKRDVGVRPYVPSNFFFYARAEDLINRRSESMGSPTDEISPSLLACLEQSDFSRKMGYDCPQCSTTFDREFELEAHVDNNHYKPFTCAYCPKTFAQRRDREEHQICHGGAFRFHCEHCENTYEEMAHLNVHIAEEHSINLDPTED